MATSELPGIGGILKARPEDFQVDEIAAYGPDGRPDRHLLVQIEKRGLDTEEAVRRLCRHCSASRGEVGVAGRKDRHAVTRQWLSFPARAADALERWSAEDLRVLAVHPHGQKLRTGHLRANRFIAVIREPGCAIETALERARAKLARLEGSGGLENLYGSQRFGHDGKNLERGLEVLATGQLRRVDGFVASAAQSALFNLYVLERRARGLLRTVLAGDVLRRTDSGGLFVAEDAAAEQARMDAGELVVTGPIFGARMRWPGPGPARDLEEEILAGAGLDPVLLRGFGKRLPGSRRPVLVDPGEVSVSPAPAHETLGPGLRIEFTLPAGSFATQLLRELQEPAPSQEEVA